MADEARELVAQAERDAESGDYSSALKALERAYAPVQKSRDSEITERALALARSLADERSLGGGGRRKARGIVSWYDHLARGHAHGGGRRSLAWIDSLIVILGLFVVLELIGGVVVALGADNANAKIAAIAAAIIGATMLLALIAVIRLLQAIERNSQPAAEAPPAASTFVRTG